MNKLPKPSINQKEYYHSLWNSSAYEAYRIQEDVLKQIWRKYPDNKNLKEIEVKVKTLNLYYSTNVIATNKVAKSIYSIKDLDKCLEDGDLSVVQKIAHLNLADGKQRDFYSFATKYCSFHNRKKCPIYDFYVQDLLYRYQKQENFYPGKITRNSITNYLKYDEYKNIIDCFISYFDLHCSYKELDMYLWTMGRTKFPRGGKKENKK